MNGVAERADRDVGRLDHRRYWMALYRRDVGRARQIVDQCLERWRPVDVYLRLFEPALALSGKLWASGCIHYRDEHFITHHTLQMLRRVRRHFVPRKTTGPIALATGASQESHLIGLRMVCDFLRADNWQVHWLESNDRATARAAAERLRPEALLLSIGLDTGLVPARRIIAWLRRGGFDGIVAVGGSAVTRDPSRVQFLGADLTAPNGLILARRLRVLRGERGNDAPPCTTPRQNG